MVLLSIRKRGPGTCRGPAKFARPGRIREGESRTLVQDGIGRLSSSHTIRSCGRRFSHLAQVVVRLSPLVRDRGSLPVLAGVHCAQPAPVAPSRHRPAPAGTGHPYRLVLWRRKSTDNGVLSGQNGEFLLVSSQGVSRQGLHYPPSSFAPQKTGPSLSARPLAGCIRREWEERAGCRGGAYWDVGEVPLQPENRTCQAVGCSLVTRCTPKGTNCTLASPTGKEADCGSVSLSSASGFGAAASHSGAAFHRLGKFRTFRPP